MSQECPGPCFGAWKSALKQPKPVSARGGIEEGQGRRDSLGNPSASGAVSPCGNPPEDSQLPGRGSRLCRRGRGFVPLSRHRGTDGARDGGASRVPVGVRSAGSGAGGHSGQPHDPGAQEKLGSAALSGMADPHSEWGLPRFRTPGARGAYQLEVNFGEVIPMTDEGTASTQRVAKEAVRHSSFCLTIQLRCQSVVVGDSPQ